MAVYTDAMDKARTKAKELGDQTKTLGEQAQTAWTMIENAVTRGVGVVNTGAGAAILLWRKFFEFMQDSSGGMNIGAGIVAAQQKAAMDAELAAAAANKPKAVNTDHSAAPRLCVAGRVRHGCPGQH